MAWLQNAGTLTLQLRVGKTLLLCMEINSVYQCQAVFSFRGLLCCSTIAKWCAEAAPVAASTTVLVTCRYCRPCIAVSSAD